ncbi:MAG: hypothetical protein KDD56_03165 [Bdellovibrionales bacterium]|nr:hypothetical protein [Bdellovibrionales bacterium]
MVGFDPRQDRAVEQDRDPLKIARSDLRRLDFQDLSFEGSLSSGLIKSERSRFILNKIDQMNSDLLEKPLVVGARLLFLSELIFCSENYTVESISKLLKVNRENLIDLVSGRQSFELQKIYQLLEEFPFLKTNLGRLQFLIKPDELESFQIGLADMFNLDLSDARSEGKIEALVRDKKDLLNGLIRFWAELDQSLLKVARKLSQNQLLGRQKVMREALLGNDLSSFDRILGLDEGAGLKLFNGEVNLSLPVAIYLLMDRSFQKLFKPDQIKFFIDRSKQPALASVVQFFLGVDINLAENIQRDGLFGKIMSFATDSLKRQPTVDDIKFIKSLARFMQVLECEEVDELKDIFRISEGLMIQRIREFGFSSKEMIANYKFSQKNKVSLSRSAPLMPEFFYCLVKPDEKYLFAKWYQDEIGNQLDQERIISITSGQYLSN